MLGGFPGGTGGKEPACQRLRVKRLRFSPWGREDPQEEGMATHLSLAGFSPWGHKKSQLRALSMFESDLSLQVASIAAWWRFLYCSPCTLNSLKLTAGTKFPPFPLLIIYPAKGCGNLVNVKYLVGLKYVGFLLQLDICKKKHILWP